VNQPKTPADAAADTGDGDAGFATAMSTTQRVANELRQRIIRAELPPGQKLKVESLKSLLQTGASPIREALSLLTSDQLVERIDQRGFRVAAVSTDHFNEILTLRCELETIALKASVEFGDDQWEEQVLLCHHRLGKLSRSDQDRWEMQHKLFHQSLLNACRSPILLRFCEQLYDLNIRYRYLAGKSTRYSNRDIEQEHERICQATLDRDTESACAHLQEHYTATGVFVREQFDN